MVVAADVAIGVEVFFVLGQDAVTVGVDAVARLAGPRVNRGFRVLAVTRDVVAVLVIIHSLVHGEGAQVEDVGDVVAVIICVLDVTDAV